MARDERRSDAPGGDGRGRIEAVPPASGDACVLVIGMHRSGTSATTGLLAHLGLAVSDAGDLLTASRAANERGHWESTRLMGFNMSLMRHLGGTWSTPPRLEPGWELDPSLDSRRHDAKALFDATLATRPSVWKDPRNCILLPFWRRVLDPPVAAVFVGRDPVEVARSLEARNSMPLTYALAVWERHLRDAARNLDGIPTIVADYADTLSEPDAWCERLVAFLARAGIAVDPGAAAGAADFLDADLRHQHTRAGAGPDLPPSTTALWTQLRDSVGEHLPWRSPDIGDEPGWVDDMLVVARRAELARLEQSALHRSRAYRFAQTVSKLRHRDPSP